MPSKYANKGELRVNRGAGGNDTEIGLKSAGGAYFSYVKSDAMIDRDKKKAEEEAAKVRRPTHSVSISELPDFEPQPPPEPEPDVSLLEKLEKRVTQEFAHNRSSFAAYYAFMNDDDTSAEGLTEKLAAQMRNAHLEKLMDSEVAATFIHTTDVDEAKLEEEMSAADHEILVQAAGLPKVCAVTRASKVDGFEQALGNMRGRVLDDVRTTTGKAVPELPSVTIKKQADEMPQPEKFAAKNLWQRRLQQAVKDVGAAVRSKKEGELAKWKEIVRLAKEPGVVVPMSKRSGRGKTAY